MNFRKSKGLPSCTEINGIDIVDFLATIDYHPKRISGNNYWYLSPFRFENTPSFKVNRKLNRLFDFGTGEGSTLVDFGIRHFKCTIRELIQKLSTPLSLALDVPQINYIQREIVENYITNLEIFALRSSYLIDYIRERRFALNVAQKFCKDAAYQVGKRTYNAICFRNNSGGYELRNKYYKGSSSPKDITLINNNNSNAISVFEGFFDFHSCLTLFMGQGDNLPNFLILNSFSFFEKNMELMEKYQLIELSLDNDPGGLKSAVKTLKRSPAYIDHRNLYKGYKDLNDFICGIKRNDLNHPM